MRIICSSDEELTECVTFVFKSILSCSRREHKGNSTKTIAAIIASPPTVAFEHGRSLPVRMTHAVPIQQ